MTEERFIVNHLYIEVGAAVIYTPFVNGFGPYDLFVPYIFDKDFVVPCGETWIKFVSDVPHFKWPKTIKTGDGYSLCMFMVSKTDPFVKVNVALL